MSSSQELDPVTGPVSGTIRPPGSKSITNRALIIAALAEGESVLTGVLDSQDTRVMITSLRRLGIDVSHDADTCTCRIMGCGGHIQADRAELFVENSGTSIRFLTAMCALGVGHYTLDGIPRMRERPISDLVDALNALGGRVTASESGCPPVEVNGIRLPGGQASIAGSISSQYLSGLLMSSPYAQNPVSLVVDGELVSKPYVTMTLTMMESFGADVTWPDDLSRFDVASQKYQGREYDVEPDASAASYLFGVAAVTGGSITVTGLHQNALQGDVHFVSALEQMGCHVEWGDDRITVTGAELRGVDIDMNAISDTAQTLATVAVFAEGPTTIRNVGHMRHKETDRVAAVVTELQRAGIRAEETDDGLRVYPGEPQPADIETYDDHRMAMSFALLGLRAEGIRILDPGCTGKTYPRFFEDLAALCRGELS
ncbi:MAG TPA: 3-phosphoshikimate 1-carboxyvinyltransferase [Planctomycetaceae bacterium]|nr:3-phosphoshikimate 1-carboxyvinyltransferase [Planctomycetaceae bacterium]